MYELVVQTISLLGSALILGAFIAAQLRKLKTTDAPYVLLNLVGSGILAFVAAIEHQWGFLLLEGVWALVSLWSTTRLVTDKSI